MVYGTAIDVGYIILSMIKFLASVRMKRLRSSLVSSRELLRIAARRSDRRSECRMDEDYIVLHSSDSDGDRRDSESDEAACGSPTRRPMVIDEEAHGSAPRGELTFSDADSDEEARGSSTRGELIISDSDSDEEGCGYGSNEPIILDSDSDSRQITTAPRLHCVFVAISQISQIRRIPIPVAIPEFRVLP